MLTRIIYYCIFLLTNYETMNYLSLIIHATIACSCCRYEQRLPIGDNDTTNNQTNNQADNKNKTNSVGISIQHAQIASGTSNNPSGGGNDCVIVDSINDIKNILNGCGGKSSMQIGGKGICLKKIKYKDIDIASINNLTKLNDYDDDKLGNLKKQCEFLNVIAKAYYWEAVCRMKRYLMRKNNKSGISVFLSLSGAGACITYSTAAIQRKLTQNDQQYLSWATSDSIKLPNDVCSADTINSAVRGEIQCYDNRIFVKQNSEKFCILCAHWDRLLQLGNPLLAVYDGGIQLAQLAYNAGILSMNLFEDSNSTLISDTKITEESLNKYGASCEKDMIMLAATIVLNNLLYDIYDASYKSGTNVKCNIAFNSFGARNFEMLLAIWKKNYDGLTTNGGLCINKDQIQCTILQGLIGNNKLCYESGKDTSTLRYFNVNKIFEDGVNKFAGISADRMQYFNTDGIFGITQNELLKYWTDNTHTPLMQIITKVRSNGNNDKSRVGGFIKGLLNFDQAQVQSSGYNSKYHDGMLSDEGLFSYHNSEFRKNVEDILNTYVNNKLGKYDYKNSSSISNLIYSNGQGTFIIYDDVTKIYYIHVGAGNHTGETSQPYCGKEDDLYAAIELVNNHHHNNR